MTGRPAMMAGVALVASLAAAPVAAQQAAPSLEDRVRALEAQLGQTPSPGLTLEERVRALETRLAQGGPSAQMPSPALAQAPAAPNLAQPAPVPTVAVLAERVEQNAMAVEKQATRLAAVEQKTADTTVTGRMYYDLTHISQSSDGVDQAARGLGFDAKRFYVSIDHRFNAMFSGDITTDFNYVAADKQTQLFIKKAYLQATFSDAAVVRLGAADLPWIPFVEDIYSYRYVETVLQERPRFGTSADWGVHVLGKFAQGLVNYQVSLINGAGYKQLTRSKGMDVEARVNFNYHDFVLGLGVYAGKLGKDVEGTTTFHDATRFDAIAAYTGGGARIGVQYMLASNWNNVTTPAGDSSEGVSVFGSYQLVPQWTVFGRYDHVLPSEDLNPDLTDEYFNVGITYSPARIVDFSLVYKHETVDNGFLSTTNGTVGGLVNAPGHSGSYDEAGVFGQFRW